MTRKQLLRNLVGLLLLPNVTAWQFAIPRKAKRSLKPLYWLLLRYCLARFEADYNKSRALMELMRSAPVTAIGGRVRIPFTARFV